jgi:hypothetical protein
MGSNGKCLKCGSTINLSKHHVFPRRHFQNGHRPLLIHLCRQPCHDELEKLLPENPSELEAYLRVTYYFIGEDFINILDAYDPDLAISLLM